MRADPPTFHCDQEGCRSYCQLAGTDRDFKKELEARGWQVIGNFHWCPAHATPKKAVIVAEETHTGDE